MPIYTPFPRNRYQGSDSDSDESPPASPVDLVPTYHMKSSPIVVVNHITYPTLFCPSLFRTITTQPWGYSTSGPAFTHQPAAAHHHQTPANKAAAIHSCGQLPIRFQINRQDAAMIAGFVRLRNLRKTQMWRLQVEKKSLALEMSVDTAFKKRKREALDEAEEGEERGVRTMRRRVI